MFYPVVLKADKNLPSNDKRVMPDKRDTVPLRIPMPQLMDEGDIESFDEIDATGFDGNAGMGFYETYDPTFDYEGIWDTISVNPYKIDLSQKPDTTLINLQDGLQCDYAHPFPGHVTSDFGPRGRHRYHLGIDIKLATGDTVKCAFEGVVRIARRSSTFGNVVMVRHKNGLETIYAHLSRIDVKIGQRVEAGELLGLGGNTGRSYGSHLHFEVRYKGVPIDPNKLINFNHCELRTDTLLIDKHTFAYKPKPGAKNYGKTRTYVVRKGDTLGKIAHRTGTTVKRLCKINGIKSTTILRPGRKLKVG